MMKVSLIFNVGALILPLGPITCFNMIDFSSFSGSKVCTFFPFAVVIVRAPWMSSQAASASKRSFLASAVAAMVIFLASRTS